MSTQNILTIDIRSAAKFSPDELVKVKASLANLTKEQLVQRLQTAFEKTEDYDAEDNSAVDLATADESESISIETEFTPAFESFKKLLQEDLQIDSSGHLRVDVQVEDVTRYRRDVEMYALLTWLSVTINGYSEGSSYSWYEEGYGTMDYRWDQDNTLFTCDEDFTPEES